MIICRMTKSEYLQIGYLDDNGISIPEFLQVKISPKDLPYIENILTKTLKRIEMSFNKHAYIDADVFAEGQCCICLYHAINKAVITIRGSTISLHFSVLSDLKNEISKLL